MMVALFLHVSIIDIPISGGSSGGSKVGASPIAQNFLNFMRCFWIIWQNRGLAPPPGRLAPLLWGILDPPLDLHWHISDARPSQLNFLRFQAVFRKM